MPDQAPDMCFDYLGKGLLDTEKAVYLDALKTIKQTTEVRSVMLYTLARLSMQPEAINLAPLSKKAMDEFADEIARLGFNISVAY